jgi:hypothetical protein
MSGSLTMSLANLDTLIGHVSSVPNLPPSAIAEQTSLVGAMRDIYGAVADFQKAVLATAPVVQGGLQRIIAQMQAAASAASLGAAMAGLTPQMTALQARATAIVDQASGVASRVGPSLRRLGAIQSGLLEQLATVQGEIAATQGALDTAQRRYRVLSILSGLAGAPELAAALALCTHLKPQFAEQQARIDEMKVQVLTVPFMVVSCQSLANAEVQFVQALTALKCGIDAVVSDFARVQDDLRSATTPETALFAQAALTELDTVVADAS